MDFRKIQPHGGTSAFRIALLKGNQQLVVTATGNFFRSGPEPSWPN